MFFRCTSWSELVGKGELCLERMRTRLCMQRLAV